MLSQEHVGHSSGTTLPGNRRDEEGHDIVALLFGARCWGGTGAAARSLTLQPIGHKLRLIKYMRSKANRVRIVALLLGIIFLGAQFHFCTDMSASPSATHFCPVCSVVGSVVTTQSPTVALIPVSNRLEAVSVVLVLSSAFPHAVSPRAPPTL